jgi:hypothetical protein
MLVNGNSLFQKHLNRTKRLPLIVIFIVLLTFAAPMQSLDTSAQSPKQKGISYAAWWSGDYIQPGADYSLELLRSTGADWISLIVTCHQEAYTSTAIDCTHESTPRDDELVHVINTAHSLGLKVMLKPHVDLFNEVEGGYWRGDIGSGFTTEGQWSAWFASYRSLIEHYARLAQDYGADQFCVGTELLGTTPRANDWRAVVAGVRAIYHGPITYAALKGGEETSITWWDAVDYIGVDGYYQLTTDLNHDPTEAELEADWNPHISTLANLSAANGNKPILLTEIGYRSQHGCSCHPWDSLVVSPVDLEEQTYAYQAAFKKLYNQPWLGGMFWWFWSPNRFESGPCDDGFSPHLKPAEDILRAWYGGPTPPPQPPTLLPDYSNTLDIYTDNLASGWQNWSWGTVALDMAATGQVFNGTHSIAVTLGPWGALSLGHPAFDTSQYHWLEFYILGSSTDKPHLVAFFYAEDGTELDHVPIDDCRHIAGGTIDAGTWKLVRIPLSDLNRSGGSLSRLSIQDQNSQGSSFWIDGLRLVGSQEPSSQVYLPMVVQNSF